MSETRGQTVGLLCCAEPSIPKLRSMACETARITVSTVRRLNPVCSAVSWYVPG
jgi:hypothetical protein